VQVQKHRNIVLRLYLDYGMSILIYVWECCSI